MNAAKYNELLRSLNAMAVKVLEACPLAEPWTKGAICGEMTRLGYSNDMKVVTGCLATLTNMGLVREPKPGTFIRVTPRVTLRSAAKADAEQEAAPADTGQATTPAEERLADVASRVRQAAAALQALAAEAEDIALQVLERVQALEAKTAQFKQLQSLMRELGNQP